LGRIQQNLFLLHLGLDAGHGMVDAGHVGGGDAWSASWCR
jgi:hypothetical protein